MSVVVQKLLSDISEGLTERTPEKWQHPTDPDPLRKDIVAAMNELGWEFDGIPGVLPFVCSEIEAGRLEAFSTFNNMRCFDASQVRTHPAKWYVSDDAASRMKAAFLALPTSDIPESAEEAPSVIAVESKHAETAAIETPAPTSNKQQPTLSKMRRHTLDDAIEEAIKKSGSYQTAAVWEQLKELALSGAPPFSGEISDRKLHYTNSRNKPDTFAKKSLGQRLRRVQQAR